MPESGAAVFHVLISEAAELSGYSNRRLHVQVDGSLASRPEELIGLAAEKDALVVRNMTKVNDTLIGRLKSTPVRVIGRLGVGLDNIDVKAAREAGLQVVYTPDANTEAVAQYALGQILLLTRSLSGAHCSTVRGEWNRQAFTGRELSELTVGIAGLGRIGSRLACILSSFGSRILVCEQRREIIPPAYAAVSLDELFRGADVVSLHVPLTAETRGLIGPGLLGLMRPGAILLNTSRGEVIQEDALDAFLRSRPDVCAVLDVRANEPPKDHLFRDLPNARLSPHIAAFTLAAQNQVLRTVLDDVERVLSGEAPLWPAP